MFLEADDFDVKCLVSFRGLNINPCFAMASFIVLQGKAPRNEGNTQTASSFFVRDNTDTFKPHT